VHLAVVRGVAGELGCPDGEPIDALGWPAGLLHEPRPAVRPAEADHLAGQVDPSTRFDLVRRRHVTLFPVRRRPVRATVVAWARRASDE
jgi:hypothetical protein